MLKISSIELSGRLKLSMCRRLWRVPRTPSPFQDRAPRVPAWWLLGWRAALSQHAASVLGSWP